MGRLTFKEIRHSIDEDLVDILKKNNALTRYVRNVHSSDYQSLYPLEYRNSIHTAFSWMNSPEGYGYWQRLYHIHLYQIQNKSLSR